jgi:predicted S18 family serine protease
MVHALEKIRPWLVPGGCVLVIHDLVDPPRVEVHNREHHAYAGQILSVNYFENQYQADHAVDSVIQSGYYFSKHSSIFEYYIRATSLSVMVEYLEETWESASIPDGTLQKVNELVEILGEDSEVVLRMISRIVKLETN